MEFEILDIRPFCLFKEKELGIAIGYFAGSKFAETYKDEYITEVSGRSFGWIDSEGMEYKDDKSKFTRPTEEQIRELITPTLYELALSDNLIESK